LLLFASASPSLSTATGDGIDVTRGVVADVVDVVLDAVVDGVVVDEGDVLALAAGAEDDIADVAVVVAGALDSADPASASMASASTRIGTGASGNTGVACAICLVSD
jgi:hypothetical protein